MNVTTLNNDDVFATLQKDHLTSFAALEYTYFVAAIMLDENINVPLKLRITFLVFRCTTFVSGNDFIMNFFFTF